MKIINIILCVLILLLGIVSAVFSYFLFEKRSQFVTGWAKMAETMNKTASALDKGSGTKIASELTAQALAHENYSNMDSLLPKLPQQSANIITERDALADALSRISRSIQLSDSVQLAKLQDLNTYSPQKDMVVRGVADAIGKRNSSYRNLANAFRSQLNIQVDQKKLLDGDAAAFDAFKKELSKRNTRKNLYENRFREIAGLLRASSPNFSEEKYDESLRKIVADIRSYRDNANTTANELRQAKSKIDGQERTIASMKKAAQKTQEVIEDKKQQITSFQRAFGIPDAAEAPKPWLPGSQEVRSRLTGKITMVNRDYGYVVMNIGKYSVVQQQIGNRILEINPNVEPGLEIIVTRAAKDKRNFIARLKISQVGESSSIANIPPESAELRSGDEIAIAPAEAGQKVKPAPQKAAAPKKATAQK